MPFKLKLKKSRHYSVASKSLFVLSVEMLDGTNVESTLSSESTGQDCLDVVCQKLGLNQPKFFGLQYMRRNAENTYYWLELDRPIKRQLDKYAKGLTVYLRVMYYVISGVRLLKDEVTRSHYFLQLKMDVIEGRISCTPQQAVKLASYSMQAEFGNFDLERHTAHYLKDFQLFPKSFTDPALLESLTDAAIHQHATLHNLPQGTAEEFYICACQQLEGYGQEIYAVKDNLGDDAVISISLTEVSIGYLGEKQRRNFGWADIKNVINHKRDFIIETVSSEKVEFQFSDVESARNVWRFCVLQHTFYRQYEVNSDETDKAAPTPVFQQNLVGDKLRQMDSSEDVAGSQQWDCSVSTQSLNNNMRSQSTSCLDLNKPTSSAVANVDTLKSLLPSYRPAPDYETAVLQKYRNSSSAIQQSQVEPLRSAHAPSHHSNILYSSQPEIHQAAAESYTTQLRYPDVTHNNIEQKNILTSIYGQGFSTRSQVMGNDSRRNFVENVGLLHLYKPPPVYTTNRISSSSTPDLAGISHHSKPHSHFISNIVSGSSPDLVSGNLYLKHYDHHHQGFYSHHHPAAHPIHRSHSYLPVGAHHQQQQQQTHGTYENVSSLFGTAGLGRPPPPPPPQALIVEDLDVTKHIKKVYNEHGNIIYCMPANIKQLLQQQENQQLTEPIYENIPLPWQNDASNPTDHEMRARTQSIHSAPPEISQATNHTVTNALQSQFQHHFNLNEDHHRGSGNLSDSNRESLYANIERRHSNTNLSSTPAIPTTVNSNDNKNPSNLGTANTDSASVLADNNVAQVAGDSTTMSATTTVSDFDQFQQPANQTFIINRNSMSTTSSNSFLHHHLLPHQNQNQQHLSQPYLHHHQSENISTTAAFDEQPPCATSSPASHSTTTNSSSTSSTTNQNQNKSSTSSKKRRWGGILMMGKGSKSSSHEEKIKSATLGREKDNKKNKDHQQQQHSAAAAANRNRWSTGLPRFNPLPPSISKETLCQLLENKLQDGQLFFEFDKIPKKKQNADFTTALHRDNAAFNRFKDVLPYEDNRLRLTPSKSNKFGYINASHISATVGSKQRFYIAAQGPTRVTLPHFWQSVWEAEVYLIVQLTDIGEDLNYIPDAAERCIDIGSEYQVWWEFSQNSGGHCITSKIRLCHVSSRRYRSLWHLHYTDWNDQGCPHSLPQFLAFLEEMQSVHGHSMNEIPPGHNKNPPIMVHCTAGVGRTGLTILCDLLLYTVNHNQEICIPGVVEVLRHQRAYMVQTITLRPNPTSSDF